MGEELNMTAEITLADGTVKKYDNWPDFAMVQNYYVFFYKTIAI